MWESGLIEFAVFEILQPAATWQAFNLFFTLTSIFGIYALGIGLLVKVLTRT